MSVLLMTIPVTMGLVVFFVLAYLCAVRDEQFEDLETPAHLPLSDDGCDKNTTQRSQK